MAKVVGPQSSKKTQHPPARAPWGDDEGRTQAATGNTQPVAAPIALPASARDALELARAHWATSYGSASQEELARNYARSLQHTPDLDSKPAEHFAALAERVEQLHRGKYGDERLAAEAADERERERAAVDDGALVAYEGKWAARLRRLQRAYPRRWHIPGLSNDELRGVLTLRLIDAVRSAGPVLLRHRRAGKEWGLTFLAHERRALYRGISREVLLGDESAVADRSPTEEERLLAAEWAALVALAGERAEHGLTRPQRRWLSAMKLSASAGDFFESSGKLNLAAVSRLLDRDRSSAQRAFLELRQRFVKELKKLGG
jgi:hypothetical protein